jgi:hypothetical protein
MQASSAMHRCTWPNSKRINRQATTGFRYPENELNKLVKTQQPFLATAII